MSIEVAEAIGTIKECSQEAVILLALILIISTLNLIANCSKLKSTA